MDEELTIVGKNFRALRKRLRLTQEELAEKLGMSISGERRVEGATETTMRPVFLRKLAEVSGQPIDELLKELGRANHTSRRHDLSEAKSAEPDNEMAAAIDRRNLPPHIHQLLIDLLAHGDEQGVEKLLTEEKQRRERSRMKISPGTARRSAAKGRDGK